MQTFTLYIGSNNETKELELDKIKQIISRSHDGFTIYTATGAWLGSEEATAVVLIHDIPEKIMATIAALRIDLHQDAIGYQIAPTLNFA
jgi:hypothetical protein